MNGFNKKAYIVFEVSDMFKYLEKKDRLLINSLQHKLYTRRAKDRREPLVCTIWNTPNEPVTKIIKQQPFY